MFSSPSRAWPPHPPSIGAWTDANPNKRAKITGVVMGCQLTLRATEKIGDSLRIAVDGKTKIGTIPIMGQQGNNLCRDSSP